MNGNHKVIAKAAFEEAVRYGLSTVGVPKAFAPVVDLVLSKMAEKFADLLGCEPPVVMLASTVQVVQIDD